MEQNPIEIPLEAFINVIYIPTRRRLYFWGTVRETAAEVSFAELVRVIDRAQAHDDKTRELDLLWEGYRSGTLSSNEGVLDIDNKVDRTLTGLRDAAQAQTRGAAEDDDISDEVEAFLETLFPSGLFAVTSLPFAEEVVAVERIVDLLQGKLAPMVNELGLGRLARRLATLVVEYRALLEAAPPRPEFDTVRAARRTGHGFVRQVIAMVLGRYHSDTPEHRQARSRLLGPIYQQQQAVRDLQSARRRNPGTEPGEPDLEPPADDPPAGDLPAGDLPGDE